MSDLHARGTEVRRAVLGDEHVDRAAARTTPFTADFQDLDHALRLGRDLDAPPASTGARAAASRSRRSSPAATSTNWRCTSAPRCATGSRRTS